jgi:hypothetical protein
VSNVNMTVAEKRIFSLLFFLKLTKNEQHSLQFHWNHEEVNMCKCPNMQCGLPAATATDRSLRGWAVQVAEFQPKSTSNQRLCGPPGRTVVFLLI